MREIRPSGLEGGARLIPRSYPYQEAEGEARSAIAPYLKLRFPNMHRRSVTEGLGRRRGEGMRLDNAQARGDRFQERVRMKMRAGSSYDEAWQELRKERPEWFVL